LGADGPAAFVFGSAAFTDAGVVGALVGFADAVVSVTGFWLGGTGVGVVGPAAFVFGSAAFVLGSAAFADGGAVAALAGVADSVALVTGFWLTGTAVVGVGPAAFVIGSAIFADAAVIVALAGSDCVADATVFWIGATDCTAAPGGVAATGTGPAAFANGSAVFVDVDAVSSFAGFACVVEGTASWFVANVTLWVLSGAGDTAAFAFGSTAFADSVEGLFGTSDGFSAAPTTGFGLGDITAAPASAPATFAPGSSVVFLVEVAATGFGIAPGVAPGVAATEVTAVAG